MKSVCPEPDESCTIPGTRPRAEALSARTGRPPRSVTKSSWRCSASAGSRAILRSRSASFPRPSRSSRRRRRSTGEAESFRSEPSSSTARPISSATESSETSMPAVSSCSAGRSSRAVSARRPAVPARIVRSISDRLLVSSVLPRAARSAASVTSATPPRSGSAASSSNAIASVVCCWRTCTTSTSGDGRRPSASSAPGSLAAAPASRASTAGSSSSSRSCSRMRRVYGGFDGCTAIRCVIRFAPCAIASRYHS